VEFRIRAPLEEIRDGRRDTGRVRGLSNGGLTWGKHCKAICDALRYSKGAGGVQVHLYGKKRGRGMRERKAKKKTGKG